MIKSLTLRNFQSHKKSHLKFSPGVNVIVGDSDVGKTAILRAVDLVCNNNPSGANYISDWAKKCLIKMCLEDGTIRRVRSKQDNQYIINKEKPLSGFGQKVPEPVKTLLNMSDINFQSQMDVPFMLGWSPSVRGEYLSNICDLQDTITAITNANKMVREENAEIKKLETDIEEIQEEIESLSWVSDVEIILKKAEAAETEISAINKDIRKIDSLLTHYKIIKDEAKSYSSVSVDLKQIDKALKQSQELKNTERPLRELHSLVQSFVQIKSNIKITEKRIVDKEKKYKKLMPKTCPLCGKE